MKIYVITNKINGKKYVGQTTKTIIRRWREHNWKSSGCVTLFRAIQKYGTDNFTIELLQECDSMEELNQAEQEWISKLNTMSPNGYNLRPGGDGRGVVSEESRQRMKVAQSNRSKEWIANIKEGMKSRGKEWRRKLSEYRKGRKATPEQIKGLKIGWKTKHVYTSEETAGENNVRCKITEEKVREIRKLYATGEYSQQKLADMFGINQTNVGFIIRRVSWKHVA